MFYILLIIKGSSTYYRYIVNHCVVVLYNNVIKSHCLQYILIYFVDSCSGYSLCGWTTEMYKSLKIIVKHNVEVHCKLLILKLLMLTAKSMYFQNSDLNLHSSIQMSLLAIHELLVTLQKV